MDQKMLKRHTCIFKSPGKTELVFGDAQLGDETVKTSGKWP